MRHFKCLFITILLSVGSITLSAQSVFLLKQQNTNAKGLNKYLWVLPNSYSSNVANSFQKVSAIPDSLFVPFKQAKLKKTDTLVWGKITAKNELKQDFDGVLLLGGRYINRATIYVLNQQGKVTIKRSGNYVPGSQADLLEMPTYPKVRLYLKASEQKTLYICFRNFDQKPLSINLELQTSLKWANFVKERNLVQGIFQGAVILILLYHLFIFFFTLDRVYVFYTGYLFCTALYFFNFAGFSVELIFPQYPRWFFEVYLVATAFLQVCYLQFIRLYLKTWTINVFWDRVVKVGIWARLVEFVIVELIWHTTSDFALVHDIHRQYALIEIGYTITVVIAWKILKARMVNYLLAGIIFLYLGVTISIIQGSYNGILYFQAGSLIEILCFSLGLGYRIRLNEKERIVAREAVIQVQKEANEQLEQKVQERTQMLSQTNDELSTINENLQQSIRYAQRLQAGVLPLDERVEKLLPQSFIIYKPRDIVSGDFYWIEEVQNKIMIAVADCTGHGIPGAMMSMMGSTALTEVVVNRKVTAPDEILTQLDQVIQIGLQQDKTNLKDGMDIGFCLLDYENQVIDYAGAHHPLYYIDEGEMKIYKGVHKSIGGNYFDMDFKNHRLPIKKGASIFMLSDGFQDQFGGPDGRKFMKSRLKKLLLEIHQMPLAEQKNKMEEALNEWIAMNDTPQTDDILVLGIKL